MEYSVMLDVIDEPGFEGYYYAHIPALELTTQGKGIDGVLAAAKELAEEQCDQKSDPPDYSVAGESTLGTLVIRGEPLSIELRPTKISYGQMSIITIAQNEARPRSVVACAMPRRSAGHGAKARWKSVRGQ